MSRAKQIKIHIEAIEHNAKKGLLTTLPTHTLLNILREWLEMHEALKRVQIHDTKRLHNAVHAILRDME